MSAPGPVAAIAVTTDADADLRWQRWQADGVAQDRKRTMRLKALGIVVAAGLAITALIQLL